MEKEQYDLMFAQEERHWWYVGMRRISTALLEQYQPHTGQPTGRPLDILDAGCGSGGMTRYLGTLGNVSGIDLAPEALTLAKQRGLPRLARASVGAIPFRDASFDVVTSFDVLYHLNVDDDRAAISEIHRVLRPGGIALIRLPAFDWIRGAHDEVVHTRHRYTRDELSGKLEDAGFRLEHATYANFLLFPLAPVKRYLEHRQGSHEATDLWRPPAPVNRLLADLLSLEAIPARGMGLPWGLSVFAVARRVQPLPMPPASAPATATVGANGTGRVVAR
jgi:SAM-dependent methyltransferase